MIILPSIPYHISLRFVHSGEDRISYIGVGGHVTAVYYTIEFSNLFGRKLLISPQFECAASCGRVEVNDFLKTHNMVEDCYYSTNFNLPNHASVTGLKKSSMYTYFKILLKGKA